MPRFITPNLKNIKIKTTQKLLPFNLITYTGDEERQNSTPHGQIISNRQEQHPSVIFLPMGQVKVDQNIPQDVVHAQHADAVFLAPSEHRVHGYGDQGRRPGVQPVVEEFAHWTTGARSSRLLSVDAI